MAVRLKNFSGLTIPPAPYDTETEFLMCNFTQPAPDTSGANPVGIRLWPGDDTPRTFTRCNMLNCEPPPGSTVTKCLTALKSFGLNGTLETVEVDGLIVDSYQNRFDRVHGRREPDGSYVYDERDEDES